MRREKTATKIQFRCVDERTIISLISSFQLNAIQYSINIDDAVLRVFCSEVFSFLQSCNKLFDFIFHMSTQKTIRITLKLCNSMAFGHVHAIFFLQSQNISITHCNFDVQCKAMIRYFDVHISQNTRVQQYELAIGLFFARYISRT